MGSETTGEVDNLRSRASTLLSLWEEDMANGIDPSLPPSQRATFLDQCELVVMDVDAFESSYAQLNGTHDDEEVSLADMSYTLAEVAAKVRRLGDSARQNIRQATGEKDDALAPFRAVLRNDKLRIFDEHPAPEYEYHTSQRRLIESPEELARCSDWYFWGLIDISATAKVDGQQIKGSIEGWRVVGYHFDPDHMLVDETEERGTGPLPPKSAFA